jgi:hypothetical protein
MAIGSRHAQAIAPSVTLRASARAYKTRAGTASRTMAIQHQPHPSHSAEHHASSISKGIQCEGRHGVTMMAIGTSHAQAIAPSIALRASARAYKARAGTASRTMAIGTSHAQATAPSITHRAAARCETIRLYATYPETNRRWRDIRCQILAARTRGVRDAAVGMNPNRSCTDHAKQNTHLQEERSKTR